MSRNGSTTSTAETGPHGSSDIEPDPLAGESPRSQRQRAGGIRPEELAKQFTVLGQGVALPEFSVDAEESLFYALEHFSQTDHQARQLRALYRMTGVKRRHSIVLGGPKDSPNRHAFFTVPENDDDLGPTIKPRMELYEKKSLPLALEASERALHDADTAASDISHLITVSCSGFAAPGVDIGLMKGLGLRSTTERTHIGFMGCHGALNGLRVARSIAESNPNARILLCAVELCSLHYHYGWHPESLVANALFADGAAAIVGAPAGEGASSANWRVGGTGSCLVPDSEDAMTWRIGDHGFEMSLSARVPELIGTYLRGWITQWLQDNGLTLDDVKSWAVHPGGPKILGSVVKALDLDKDAVAVSREVLRDHGNMSSPTLLFILKQLRETGAERPCVALGFGPGLMAETTLFV